MPAELDVDLTDSIFTSTLRYVAEIIYSEGQTFSDILFQ